MDEQVTHSEDREQQAAVSRLLLYYLSAPLSEGCRLLGVLPALGAVRIAVHAGDDADGITFLYEIPHDVVAPAYIPGILRTALAGTQLYSSDDIGDVMGMTLIRLHPERITPAPESEPDRALGVLRALSDPGDDEDPFLIGFLMRGEGLLRLYVRHPDGTGVIGADIRLTDALTALIASLPSLVEEEQRHRPSPDDPHCDLLVDLTDW
ncbi:hypothetical protein OG889_09955 [Streptomyces sp. NBC_00481]|uniref:hypothetical protein n=1 Tax=Streptomyces sp. NBC_00481 TaxID=2975755 RepID=UPI002DD9E789|nr:hypothetical protein [Streptomyces sp. NBC_00481]WRY95022.1 hypothetical protein OG889_09955 [Streptomyces sp. NBC_00481]